MCFRGKYRSKKAKYSDHFDIQNGRRWHTWKNWSNSGFVLMGIWTVKSIGFTSIANLALDYITPCTNNSLLIFESKKLVCTYYVTLIIVTIFSTPHFVSTKMHSFKYIFPFPFLWLKCFVCLFMFCFCFSFCLFVCSKFWVLFCVLVRSHVFKTVWLTLNCIRYPRTSVSA